MRSAHPTMTLFVRKDNDARPGRADVAGVALCKLRGRKVVAYYGEVSRAERVVDALLVEVVPSDTDVTLWLARHGLKIADVDAPPRRR